jgi:hypothetical protein
VDRGAAGSQAEGDRAIWSIPTFRHRDPQDFALQLDQQLLVVGVGKAMGVDAAEERAESLHLGLRGLRFHGEMVWEEKKRRGAVWRSRGCHSVRSVSSQGSQTPRLSFLTGWLRRRETSHAKPRLSQRSRGPTEATTAAAEQYTHTHAARSWLIPRAVRWLDRCPSSISDGHKTSTRCPGIAGTRRTS